MTLIPLLAGQETAVAVDEGVAVTVAVAVASTVMVVLTRLVEGSMGGRVVVASLVVSLMEVTVTVGGNEPWEVAAEDGYCGLVVYTG